MRNVLFSAIFVLLTTAYPLFAQTTAADWVALGMAKIRGRDYKAASDAFTSAIALDPKIAKAWEGRASVKSFLDDSTGAIADYDKAIELYPKNSITYILKTSVLIGLKDYDRAIATCNALIIALPDDNSGYGCRGHVKRQKGDLNGALADYSKQILIDPDQFAYSNRADVRFEKKDYLGAIADLTKAIKLDPESSGFYTNRAKCYRALKRISLAVTDEKKAADLIKKLSQ